MDRPKPARLHANYGRVVPAEMHSCIHCRCTRELDLLMVICPEETCAARKAWFVNCDHAGLSLRQQPISTFTVLTYCSPFHNNGFAGNRKVKPLVAFAINAHSCRSPRGALTDQYNGIFSIQPQPGFDCSRDIHLVRYLCGNQLCAQLSISSTV